MSSLNSISIDSLNENKYEEDILFYGSYACGCADS